MDLLLTLALVLPLLAAPLPPEADAALTARAAAFIDAWHDDAAHSRQRYFDKMAPEGVYIGTDSHERWKREEFRAWAKPYFARPSAWAFTATSRNIAWSADKSIVWWDEQLATGLGLCQASGVMRQTATGGFEILHYQLSIAIPNELGAKVKALIEKSPQPEPAR